jgi:drug/metabolite transporter (DMT)-like permease
MKIDATGVGIVLGLAGAVTYSALTVIRHKRFRASATALVFLGGFAVPTSALLIRAALEGDAAQLPSMWRENVAVAGVVLLGLAVEGTYRLFREAAERTGTLSGVQAEAAVDGRGPQPPQAPPDIAP